MDVQKSSTLAAPRLISFTKGRSTDLRKDSRTDSCCSVHIAIAFGCKVLACTSGDEAIAVSIDTVT